MDASAGGSFFFDHAKNVSVSMDHMKMLRKGIGFCEEEDGNDKWVPKDSFNRKLLVAAHEVGRSAELHLQTQAKLTTTELVIVSCGVDERSLSRPSPISLSELKEIFFPQLELGKRHYGRALFGTFCVQPFRVSSVNTVLADRSGKGVRVIIYNVQPSLSSEEIEARFPMGKKVAIKEPYFKLCADLKVAVRLENPAEVVFVDESNREVVVDSSCSELHCTQNGVLPAADVALEQELDEIRGEGNRLFAEQNWDGAIVRYSKCIDRANTAVGEVGDKVKQSLLLAYSNRAEAWLRIGEFREALDDANKALSFDADHVKSLSRRDRAWRGFGKVRVSNKVKSTTDDSGKSPELLMPVNHGSKDKSKKNAKENTSPSILPDSKAGRSKQSTGIVSKAKANDSKNCTGDVSRVKCTDSKNFTGEGAIAKATDSKNSAFDVSNVKATDSKTSTIDVTKAKVPVWRTPAAEIAEVKAPDLKTSIADVRKAKPPDSKSSTTDVAKVNPPNSQTDTADVAQVNPPVSKTSTDDVAKVKARDSISSTADVAEVNRPDSKSSTSDLSKVNAPDLQACTADLPKTKSPDSKTATADVLKLKARYSKTLTTDLAEVKALDLTTPANVDKVNVADSKVSVSDGSTSTTSGVNDPCSPLGDSSEVNTLDSRSGALAGEASAVNATDSSLESPSKASSVRVSVAEEKGKVTVATTNWKGKRRLVDNKGDSSLINSSKAKLSNSKTLQADASETIQLQDLMKPLLAANSENSALANSSRNNVSEASSVVEASNNSYRDDTHASIGVGVKDTETKNSVSVPPLDESNDKAIGIREERPVVNCEGPHFAQWLETVCASGDKFLGQCKWANAVKMYDKVTEFPAPRRNRDQVLRTMVAAYSHRSEAWIWLGNFENSLRDADLALDIFTKNPRCGEGMESKQFLNEVRRGRAFHGLGEYEKACMIFIAALAKSPNDTTIKDFIEKCRICSVQSREGVYDLNDYFLNGCRGPPPPCSDFVGPIEIRWVHGKGRGLFATRDVGPGDLLLVSNPLAVIRRRFRKHLGGDEDDYSQLASKWRKRLNVFGLDEFMERLSSLSQSSKRMMYQLLSLSVGHPDEALAIAIPDMNVFIPGRQVELPANWNSLSVNLEPIVFTNAIDGGLNPLDGAHLDVGESIGCVGLWGLPSFINHSCVPNCHMIDVGNAMFVRASRKIAQGEELTRAYFDVYQDIHERHGACQDWSFVCICERCLLEKTLVSRHLLPLEVYRNIVQRAREESEKRFQSNEKDRSLSLLLPNQQPALMQLRRFANWFDRLLGQVDGLGDKERAWIGASHLHAYISRMNGSKDVNQLILSLEIILEFMTNTAILCIGQGDTPLQIASLLLDQVEDKYGKASQTYRRVEARVLDLYSTTYGRGRKDVLLSMCRIMTNVA